MAPVVPADLNPGIKRTVKWLNDAGYPTVDSGDGKTHDHECDREDPYVVVQVDAVNAFPESLVDWTNNLKEALEALGVAVGPIGIGPVWLQANYDPCNGYAFIDITGIHDGMLPEDLTDG